MMLIIDMPKKYLTDASGFVSCTMCKKYLPLLYRDCNNDFKGCLIKGVLPDEHGDLIDRDVSIQTFKCIEEAPYSGFDGQEAFYTPEDVVNTLLCQDVVIAAERKDDEQIH